MADATFTHPDAGATLGGAIQVFRWDLGGVPLDSAWLYVGSSAGGSQYAAIMVGTDTETSVGGLPTDSSAVFARLWYRIDGVWSFIDRKFTAAASPALPFLVEPQPGTSLAGDTQTFRWSFGGLEVENSWLYVGSMTGGSDYAALQTGTAREGTIDTLPTDESEVDVRLYFRVGGVWYHVDEVYTAAKVPVPTRDELTRELQRLVGVTADGIIGPATRAALNENWVGRSDGYDPSFSARFANDTDVVIWVQRRLNARNGLDLSEDGVYGPASEAAAKDDLGRSGVVAVESFEALLDS